MLEITCADVQNILQDYQILSRVTEVSELQRYDYAQDDPCSKNVRLIIRIDFADKLPLVMRLKHEADVTVDLVEQQCQFAETLRTNGIVTPKQVSSRGRFANLYHIKGYDVIVTIEQFAAHQIQVVDEEIAKKTGVLLAKTHMISERTNSHIDHGVLFDPFVPNDLFDYAGFLSVGECLTGEDRELFDRIVTQYEADMQVLQPLRAYPRFAVQGDISDCNLYAADGGELGVFDFNRAGDNILFCDAVMQAVFEARLMVYPEDRQPDFEEKILAAFWDGYGSVRALSKQEQNWIPYLYAMIDAFWTPEIRWNADSLLNARDAGDWNIVRNQLERIHQRLSKIRV